MAFISKHQVILMMQRRGFKLLGDGSFGVVFQSPKSKEVLKLFFNDSGYIEFIKIVSKNPQCIHFPKFSSFHKFPNWNSWYAIKLEPLNKITDSEWNRYDWLGAAMRFYKYDDWPLDISKSIRKSAEIGMKNYPSLAKAVQILEQGRINSTKPWPKEDLHGENVMKRADGTIVIIDPFA